MIEVDGKYYSADEVEAEIRKARELDKALSEVARLTKDCEVMHKADMAEIERLKAENVEMNKQRQEMIRRAYAAELQVEALRGKLKAVEVTAREYIEVCEGPMLEILGHIEEKSEKRKGHPGPDRCNSYWDGQQCELPADHATEKHHAVGHWWIVGKLT